MPEVKQEPPDYPSFNPYTSSHTIGDHAESILNISNPWDVAIKTMNQEMNSAVSNYLTSNPNELIEQITQNLKYSQVGLIQPSSGYFEEKCGSLRIKKTVVLILHPP